MSKSEKETVKAGPGQDVRKYTTKQIADRIDDRVTRGWGVEQLTRELRDRARKDAR